jgi:hypothetical protein
VNGEPVTRLRHGAPTGEKDRYGKPVLGPDVETPLPRALFAPASSTEPLTVGRVQVITADTLLWRCSVDLTAADRVRVRGLVREVDGTPAVWTRNGRVVGVVATLKTSEG